MSDAKPEAARRARSSAPILVASDAQTNASVMSKLLSEEFDGVRSSWVPESAVSDFEACPPHVLVLAFEELEKAEAYYLGLYRHSRTIHEHPHRTIVLCQKDDVKRVFELCRTEHFDDYILFWPRCSVRFNTRMSSSTAHDVWVRSESSSTVTWPPARSTSRRSAPPPTGSDRVSIRRSTSCRRGCRPVAWAIHRRSRPCAVRY